MSPRQRVERPEPIQAAIPEKIKDIVTELADILKKIEDILREINRLFEKFGRFRDKARRTRHISAPDWWPFDPNKFPGHCRTVPWPDGAGMIAEAPEIARELEELRNKLDRLLEELRKLLRKLRGE